MPVVLVLCFVTAVALTLYALVFLRALLVNDKGTDLARTAVKGAHTLDRVLFERYEDIKVFATDRTLLEGEEAEKTQKIAAISRSCTAITPGSARPMRPAT